MSGIFGPIGITSSSTASLQSSLESRLRARLGANGSLEYGLTWKRWDMESGPPISALRASVRRTSAKDYGGWPTPMAGTPAQKGYNEAGNTDSSRKTIALVGWATPRSADADKGVRSDAGALKESRRTRGPDLCTQAKLAGWPTTSARDWKSEKATEAFDRKRWAHARGKPLSAMATLASGANSTSFPARTEKRGALSPEHSRWLMGYPPAWASCAPTATPSSRKSRRHS